MEKEPWIWYGTTPLPNNQYSQCLIDLELVEEFRDSGMNGIKKFLKERHHNKLIAWRVIKRMEGR